MSRFKEKCVTDRKMDGQTTGHKDIEVDPNS